MINAHAPSKNKVIKHIQVPYTNCELRKSVNVRNTSILGRTLFCNFEGRCSEGWERYRGQRTLVVKFHRKNKQAYLKRKCVFFQKKSKEF